MAVMQPDHGKVCHLGKNWKLMGDPVNLIRNSSRIKANNANSYTPDLPRILLQAKSGIKSWDPNLHSEILAVKISNWTGLPVNIKEYDPVYFLTNCRLVCLIR